MRHPSIGKMPLDNMELFETKFRHLANYYVGLAVLITLAAAALLVIQFMCR